MASTEQGPSTSNEEKNHQEGSASSDNTPNGSQQSQGPEVDEIKLEETVVQQTVHTEVRRREVTATTSRRHSDESNGSSQPPTPTPSSFGLDLSTTLPPLPPAPPVEGKYKRALQKLYTQLPERLSHSDGTVDHLFSEFVITEAELEMLRATKKAEGNIAQCQRLIDVLRTKTDEEVEVWLKYLEEQSNKQTVVNWIKVTAGQLQEEQKLKRQASVAKNPKKRCRASSDSEDDDSSETKQPKLDLELILRTVPPIGSMGASNKLVVKKQGHLLISLTFKEGIDDITSYLKQNLYRLKSELSSDLNISCSCITKDERTDDTKKSCAALVSVGFVDGESEAFEILESKLIDFESYVIQQKATLVSIVAGCIKMKLRFSGLKGLEDVYSDLSSGAFLQRVSEWLFNQGYAGSDERPVFMLMVDNNEVREIREHFKSSAGTIPRRGPKHFKTLLESVELSTRNPKHDLDLIIRTIPKSTSTHEDDIPTSIGKPNTSFVCRKGPVLMSLKCLKGSDEVMGYVKHSFYKMKSEVTKSLKTPCGCITEDLRTRKDEVDTSVVSVGFEAGEKEAYKILKSNMDDFEDFVFRKTASVVSVVEGCIKVRIRMTGKGQVLAVYEALRSGELLNRVVGFLLSRGYKGSSDRAALMLTVDEEKILQILRCGNYGETLSRGIDITNRMTARRHPDGLNKVCLVEGWQQITNQALRISLPVCCV